MFYYPNVNEIKDRLQGYSPKSFTNKQELYNYIGSYLFNIYQYDTSIQYIKTNYENWLNAFKNQSFTENMLQDASNLWDEIEDDSVIFIESMNGGDGNPLESVHAILDDSTKEYTLVSMRGYYSSWDSPEFHSLHQVQLKEVTTIKFEKV